MSLNIGIVGLPNVGKSTLFNALTKSGQAAAENYPFCTIEPNVGIVPVPDDRLQKLADVVKTNKLIPATVQFVDIAGLVAGAHKGEGLGNQFLAHIRETDAIAMVVRCFTDENVIHVTGTVDPKSDIETIKLELILADLQTVTKMRGVAETKAKGHDKEAMVLFTALNKVEHTLNQEQLASLADLGDDERSAINSIQLLTNKPFLYIGNVSEADVNKDPSDFGLPSDAILISAKVESELVSLTDSEQAEYLAALGLNESGLTRLIHRAYKTLGLQYFFTAGPKEVRAWTIHQGSTAPIAAGVIHTDFIKGFIRAEVMSYDDLITLGSELKVKEAGKLRIEGKDYVMREGDVVHFRVTS
ncbi:MAG: redox-regulated ATPase YchF [Patescibacteria group bacterium]|jgi:hypothetical protein